MSEETESKLRIKDRRMFNPDGSLRELEPGEEPRREERPAPTPAPAPAAAPEPTPVRDNVVSMDAKAERRPEPEEAVDPSRMGEPSLFAELVHSLAYQAAMLMGLVRDPLGPPMPTDMRGARQTIEMIGMLKEKTRGNLSPEEATLLERMLTDLRMQFVSMSQRGPKP